MEELVAAERHFARLLAALPAIVVALCVRGLTLGTIPIAARAVAAGIVATACWSAYRILTARLVVNGDGIHVRGVLYDAVVPWTDVRSATILPAAGPIRALVWGVMTPHTIELRTSAARLRPIVSLGAHDDRQMRLVMSAIQAYLRSGAIPLQRDAEHRVTSA